MDQLTKILAASSELFRQYGFKTITMDDIARRAGISKKTLYQHFANKQEVVNETLVWYKSHMSETCEMMIIQCDNAIEGMVKLMQLLDQTYRQINPMAMLELQRYFPEAYALFREKLRTQDVSFMRENIKRGIEEGVFRKDVDAELMSRFHIETSLILFQSNILVDEHYDLQYVSRAILEHFLYGIMTPAGEQLYYTYKEKYLKKASKI